MKLLVVVALVCVPWMLVSKPVYLLILHKKRVKKVSSVSGGGGGGESMGGSVLLYYEDIRVSVKIKIKIGCHVNCVCRLLTTPSMCSRTERMRGR